MVVTQYETLRRAVLGDALPPEARAGLPLFLRRGMWGWARAVAAMSAPQRPDSRCKQVITDRIPTKVNDTRILCAVAATLQDVKKCFGRLGGR